VLATVASGLYSPNEEAVDECYRVLQRLFESIEGDTELLEVSMSWFLSSEEGGLKRSIHALRLSSGSANNFVCLTSLLCRVPQQLFVMFKEEMISYCHTHAEYAGLMVDLVGQLALQRADDVEASGLVEYWLDLTYRVAENDGVHTIDERA
jgi:hypothetical protein